MIKIVFANICQLADMGKEKAVHFVYCFEKKTSMLIQLKVFIHIFFERNFKLV